MGRDGVTSGFAPVSRRFRAGFALVSRGFAPVSRRFRAGFALVSRWFRAGFALVSRWFRAVSQGLAGFHKLPHI
jgi:hypothetical protein